jgi:hypothetical protein
VRGKIHQPQPFKADALPNEFRPKEMNAAARELDSAIGRQIQIGEIDGKKRILVLDLRIQKLERFVFESQD